VCLCKKQVKFLQWSFEPPQSPSIGLNFKINFIANAGIFFFLLENLDWLAKLEWFGLEQLWKRVLLFWLLNSKTISFNFLRGSYVRVRSFWLAIKQFLAKIAKVLNPSTWNEYLILIHEVICRIHLFVN
jgi:hypothetical protein